MSYSLKVLIESGIDQTRPAVLVAPMGIKAFCQHAVTKNAVALGVMQIANLVVPLIVFPYLSRTLGIDAFGAAIFTLASIQFAYVVTDYGFTLYATHEISEKRDDISSVNQLIGAIYGAKTILVPIAGAGIYLAGRFVEYDQYQYIFGYAFLAVVAQAFQPVWFFQGIERMRSIAIYMVASKILFALLILLLVDNPQRTSFAILAWAFAQSAAAVIANACIYREGYAISLPRLGAVIKVIKEAQGYFWSRLSVAVYTSANTIVLGLVGDSRQITFFGACDQLYRAGQNITMPVSSALFPFMVKQKAWSLFDRVVGAVAGVLICGTILISFFVYDVLELIFGPGFGEAWPIMVVFLPLLVVNYIGVSFGYPACSAIGNPDYANRTVAIGASIHLAVVTLLYTSGNITALTIACATFLTESLVMILRVSKVAHARKILLRENGE